MSCTPQCRSIIITAILTLTALSAVAVPAPDKTQAEREAREAEYYQRQAQSYRRDAEYYAREAESARRDAVYYIKQGDKSRARNYQQRAKNAISNYRSKVDAALRADERCDYYLQRAAAALDK